MNDILVQYHERCPRVLYTNPTLLRINVESVVCIICTVIITSDDNFTLGRAAELYIALKTEKRSIDASKTRRASPVQKMFLTPIRERLQWDVKTCHDPSRQGPGPIKTPTQFSHEFTIQHEYRHFIIPIHGI